MPMHAANVFLDTVVFIQSNFNYDSQRFASITALAIDNRIRVFLTDVTLREIRANLSQAVGRAVNQRIDPILRNSGRGEVKQLLAPLDQIQIEAELMAQLDGFLGRAKVTV